MPPNIQLTIAAAAIGALALVGGVAWFWTRRSRTKPDSPINGLPEEASSPISPGPVSLPQHDSPSDSPREINTAALAELSSKIPDPDIREFLVEIAERVEEVGSIFDDDTPYGFIEEIVDRLDDLRSIRKRQSDRVASEIDSFRTILSDILAKCGVEPIHCELWDASNQRAVSKEPTPGITVPTILRFGSTGIRRNGKLMRKQEVVLAIPETH